MEYSLVKIFGSLPVHPDQFRTLDPKLKWMGKAKEGESFCTGCGTLSPNAPRKHHPECDSYKDTDEYEQYVNPLGKCPECESEDSLSINSSRELQVSVISCSDCLYRFSDSVPEETLTERFLARKLTITAKAIEDQAND